MRGRKLIGAVIAIVTVLAAAFFGLRRHQASPSDGYDYAAAFESLDAGSAAPVVKIPEIAGRSMEELRALLGPPERCEASRYSSRCTYAPGRTEVVFIAGKADWITVNELGETPFKPAALGRLGLPASTPLLSSEAQLGWKDVAGLKEVSLVGSGERVEFARVKVATP